MTLLDLDKTPLFFNTMHRVEKISRKARKTDLYSEKIPFTEFCDIKTLHDDRILILTHHVDTQVQLYIYLTW